MMRNMAGMMKKVQEMQSRMEALQQEMADTEFSAAVGGGAVQVTVTGKGEMRGVKIDPAAVDLADIGMLEDMIRLAANNARAEADAAMAAKMKDITGGMPLPPGMSLPF
ncbi:MAG: YbaB/EbfC family nucleoid-associated protein [Pseudomonadota bacterium]|nr:YbaB/EbfC family nucleoid-associated protein [Pseudomonadota bacterium]